MASISACGTGFAAPTPASGDSRLNRFARRLGAALIVVGVLPAAAPTAEVDVSVSGLRSSRGMISLCLVRDTRHFPDCEADPQARRATVPASQPRFNFTDLPAGDYAVSLIHDENGNKRLDTFGGVPREGVGFSRNPRLMFGPPKFGAARFTLTNGVVAEQIRVKYFL